MRRIARVLTRTTTTTATKPASARPQPLQPLQLRDYQEECINAVVEHVEKGHRRMGVSLATGSGKTVVFTQLISRLLHPSRPKHATRTLILAHRTELVQQAHDHCRRTYPDLTIDVEMASLKASGTADITIASIQSITSGSRIEKFDPSSYKLILIDEAHHAVAQRYMDTLDYFGVLDMEKGDPHMKPILVGVSATLSRNDGLALGKVLDYIVYHRDYVDMIEDNWLCPVKFTTVQTNVDLSRVRATGNDFAVGELSRAVNTDQANETVVRSWLQKARQRESTIVFCVDISHVNEITAKFRQYGIDARPVTSLTTAQDRKDRLAAFRTKQFPVLVNCGVFTEGTDIPNIDCVLLARPTKSKNLLIQMIGRGMRLHPDKKDCHVIDMVGSIERGVATVPTLFGLDPDELLDDESMEAAKTRVSERKAAEAGAAAAAAAATPLSDAKPRQAPFVSFTNYPDVFSLLADSRQDLHIRSISPLCWVSISPSLHVLSMRSGFLKIFPSPNHPDTWDVTATLELPKELKLNFVKAPPRMVVSNAASLELAVKAADTFALSKHPMILLSTNAAWRKGPASEGQRALLEKVKGLKPADTLTKGHAGDMITRMRHGGMGRFEQLQKERRAHEREMERAEKARLREHVAVGAVPR
ncbi:P-loop containing nucleoside triphosphate hydrolase protein [Sphaerosporella brunnea]|uniref:P-loop containing nucleoside triphosphate hydrolase protein n=1 Tax=Sphaerosporella brunnea TaxID=1250544 RepID=A0A5J5EXM2_9PEZI|nr:P-loop containing nucleoside triphosphate hydrolase protein [Sphaerosporella brunnea]